MDTLHRPGLANLLCEEEGDRAVVEPPVPLEVARLNELDRVQKMLLELVETFGATVDLDTRYAERQ